LTNALKIISDCWIFFAVIWMVAAFWTKQTVYQERRANLLRYSLPLLIGAYLIFRGPRFVDPLGFRVVPRIDIVAWIGVALCVGGLLFCIWARFTLGRNWSGLVTFKGGHELIMRGPYAIVRHPIYTGILLMLVGTVIVYWAIAYGSLGANFTTGGGEALANPSRAVGALVLVKTKIIGVPLVFWGLWIKLRYEENLMREKFPEEYANYSRHVKRLIPGVL
jgi:protein-S-isoprenylcysteine O-methyltransferase Ste14